MTTPKHFQRWWQEQPAEQVCRDCGKRGGRAYVQPQYDRHKRCGAGYALCTDCITRLNRDWRVKRKAQLATEPRCEVPNCKRRGTKRYGWGGDKALLCGQHGKQAERVYQGRCAGACWLPGPAVSAAKIIELATE